MKSLFVNENFIHSMAWDLISWFHPPKKKKKGWKKNSLGSYSYFHIYCIIFVCYLGCKYVAKGCKEIASEISVKTEPLATIMLTVEPCRIHANAKINAVMNELTNWWSVINMLHVCRRSRILSWFVLPCQVLRSTIILIVFPHRWPHPRNGLYSTIFEAGGTRKADETVTGSIGDNSINNKDHNGFSGYLISLVSLVLLSCINIS